MRRSRAARATVAVLIVLLAGCGSRVTPRQLVAEGRAGTETPAVPGPSTETPAGPEAPGRESPAAVTAGERPPVPAGPPPTLPAGPEHNQAVTIELSSTCISRGDLLTATVRGAPGAGVSMVVGYSDNHFHGSMGWGVMDDAGVYVWRFPIPLEAPEGWANILAAATGRDWNPDGTGGTEGGGTASEPFLVAADCG